MFAILKGVSFSDVGKEVNKVKKDFQLEDVQYTMTINLSAGKRRKLSITISLILKLFFWMNHQVIWILLQEEIYGKF